MLRTDKRTQITSDRYYRVLSRKSEGGTGDTQIELIGPMIDVRG